MCILFYGVRHVERTNYCKHWPHCYKEGGCNQQLHQIPLNSSHWTFNTCYEFRWRQLCMRRFFTVSIYWSSASFLYPHLPLGLLLFTCQSFVSSLVSVKCPFTSTAQRKAFSQNMLMSANIKGYLLHSALSVPFPSCLHLLCPWFRRAPLLTVKNTFISCL